MRTKPANKIYHLIGIATIFILLLPSCLEQFHNIELPEQEPQLVINSFFDTDSPLRISLTSSYSRENTNEFLPIYNATIFLYEDDKIIEQLEGRKDTIHSYWSKTGQWFYFSNLVKHKEGKRYKLQASAPGYDTVYAETVIPAKTHLQITDTSWFVENNERFLRIFLAMNTPDEKRWHYLATAHLNAIYLNDNTLLNKPIVGYSKTHFPFMINNAYLGKREGRLNEDFLIFNNEHLTKGMHSFFVDVRQQDTERERMTVDLCTLSDDALKYLSTLTDFKNNDIRYNEPVKVYSNTSNGLGIFAAMNLSCDTLNFSH